MSFLSFTASEKDGDALLSWATVSENNNKGFEIERSVDGHTFSYTGFVQGKNIAAKLSYTFTDADAFNKEKTDVLSVKAN